MKSLRRQRGAVLIVMVTILVLGFAWFAVGALGKTAVSVADREKKTAQALQAAKKALLGHVAQYAARSSFQFPGRMPCPESLASYGGASEGQAPGACSNTLAVVGRLPWQTLGIDQLRDADGEPLWYVLGANFHPTAFPLNAVAPNPYLNFGTPAALPFDGANVVALIIAPGRALASNPCNVVNQNSNRYATPLDPLKFFECGNATGAYTNPGSANTGSNDRVLAITQSEWAEAIAGPVADRVQREVAAAIDEFRTTTSLNSWGQSFLPYASTWSTPLTNDLCGNQGIDTGMPPTATVASGTCDTNWTTGSASGFLAFLLNFGACTPDATYMTCDFTALLGGLLSPNITVTAPRIAYSFRSIDPALIQISRNGGAWTSATTQNYSASVSPATGSATFTFEIVFPLLSILDNVRVRIPHPADALVADARSSWWVNNAWDRYTYYAITQAATTNAGGAVCNPGGNVSSCLIVNGMSAPTDDKRLVLALMGRAPIGTLTWPSANLADYLEGQNATPADRTFEIQTVTASFNDRLAACPFGYTDASGTLVTVCN